MYRCVKICFASAALLENCIDYNKHRPLYSPLTLHWMIHGRSKTDGMRLIQISLDNIHNPTFVCKMNPVVRCGPHVPNPVGSRSWCRCYHPESSIHFQSEWATWRGGWERRMKSGGRGGCSWCWWCCQWCQRTCWSLVNALESIMTTMNKQEKREREREKMGATMKTTLYVSSSS